MENRETSQETTVMTEVRDTEGLSWGSNRECGAIVSGVKK